MSPHVPLAPITLILGGARSGKSALAERLAESQPGPCVYVATAEAWDEEMTERIAQHQARRGNRWHTHEAPRDLVACLQRLSDGGPERPGVILVDCLTLWLTNIMLAERAIGTEIQALTACLPDLRVPVILVSNEVGLGIVPENALARRFRDHAGRLNQATAAVAHSVIFVAAGLPLVLKGEAKALP